MAPFVDNGTKIKIPSEIKPPLEPQPYQALGNLKRLGGADGHLRTKKVLGRESKTILKKNSHPFHFIQFLFSVLLSSGPKVEGEGALATFGLSDPICMLRLYSNMLCTNEFLQVYF